ncbi:Ketosteroid isomerase-related protein [Arthrobacter sp. cf158]|uniref:PhzA/PhzB family protein n=1 Tax=Arthrobacter sp. cf158 TaxID=1761744 RepID=UPI00089C70E8|nr:PhzA/PhzB family protein [Arthrobacter sp. cf158]SDX49760.1 Ketosteroid isomerase-related protein [Arthrobacter sp. cf158]
MAHSSIKEVNRRTVERFFVTSGLERAALFAVDGRKELPWTSMGHPIDMEGIREISYNFTRNRQIFTDWTWSGVEVFDTQYDDRFWAECDGRGVIRIDGHEPVNAANHYVMAFRLEDGKIKEFREFCDPTQPSRNDAGDPVPTPPLGDWKPPAEWQTPAELLN